MNSTQSRACQATGCVAATPFSVDYGSSPNGWRSTVGCYRSRAEPAAVCKGMLTMNIFPGGKRKGKPKPNPLSPHMPPSPKAPGAYK